MEWLSPALAWAKVMPAGASALPGLSAGVPLVSRPSSPWVLSPQVYALPCLSRATVWPLPALTRVKATPAGVSALLGFQSDSPVVSRPSWPTLLFPQV